MSIGLKRMTAVICAAILTIFLLVGFDMSAGENGQTKPPTDFPIYIDGIRVGSGITIQDEVYVPLRAFCEALTEEVTISWDGETNTATVEMSGLLLVAEVGERYLIANDRVMYAPELIAMSGDSVYLPLTAITKAFTLESIWDAEHRIVEVRAANMAPLVPADEFYDETDLLWLSRIINAESGNQQLDGKIGVGNVVLNRVADPSCPDTVEEVIFDSRFGVQFHPTTSTIIYETPNDESVLAAKICMEGYNTVGDSLYFVNPDIGATAWFRETRTFVATLGDHDFYA